MKNIGANKMTEYLRMPQKPYPCGTRSRSTFFIFLGLVILPGGFIDMSTKIAQVRARSHREALALARSKGLGAGGEITAIELLE